MTIVNNAVNQANFNATRTAQLNIPFPPVSEQYRIMAEVERRLSLARQIGQAVEGGLARAVRLRQAILKAAFEGRL